MGYKVITNLLHQDQVDLQRYTEVNHLALYASIPSENTGVTQHIVKTNYLQSVTKTNPNKVRVCFC